MAAIHFNLESRLSVVVLNFRGSASFSLQSLPRIPLSRGLKAYIFQVFTTVFALKVVIGKKTSEAAHHKSPPKPTNIKQTNSILLLKSLSEVTLIT